MALEINLVPDIKGQMIKTLKLRNFVFFVCIIVAAASIGAVVVFWTIAAGQQAVADGKKGTLELLHTKINSYDDLSQFLTVEGQLSNLKGIEDNKQVLSRTFGILSTLIPAGPDSITVSALNINLSGDAPTFTFDAQADARTAPYIDYNVLDSFKKSMQYMRYDYGDYVDKNGATIPAYCIIETADDGATFYDAERQSYYAYWLITGEGCNPAAPEKTDTDETETEVSNEELLLSEAYAGYTTEDYNGQTVVKIWRTPQYAEWYKGQGSTSQNQSQNQNQTQNQNESQNQTEGESGISAGSITLDGQISGVAHFESACIKYSGVVNASGQVEWTETDDCRMVPDDGIKITDSSNGRDASDQLVLRFGAVITLNPEVYKFTNHHMLGIAPAGRRNVTDSYVQVQKLFAERAADCEDDDISCNNNTRNENGGEQ